MQQEYVLVVGPNDKMQANRAACNGLPGLP